jgi:hypothetical protein
MCSKWIHVCLVMIVGIDHFSTTLGFQFRFASSTARWTRKRHPTPARMVLPEQAEEIRTDSGLIETTPSYSRELYLREEAESPFRKVRFFFYLSLGAGAATSLAVSTARIGAALAGVNVNLLDESVTNAAVDLTGIIVLYWLYQRDIQAQDSRLKRASKGAELAKLRVKLSKSLVMDSSSAFSNDQSEVDAFTTTLASMRRGRGIEKRVVIVVCGVPRMNQVFDEIDKLGTGLVQSDLLIVPVLYPQAMAPTFDCNLEEKLRPFLALPLGPGWKSVINDEATEAMKQGVDVVKDGICIVLKKNGKVGQRTRGIFLHRMVSDVSTREMIGMDINNI